jgi:hypothetical protein
MKDKDNDAATKWAVDYLESHDLQTDSHSIVIKINTSQGVFFLKQTPNAYVDKSGWTTRYCL